MRFNELIYHLYCTTIYNRQSQINPQISRAPFSIQSTSFALQTPLVNGPWPKHGNRSIKSTSFRNFGREIFADAQFLESDLVFQRETFLVREMQQADEAIRGGDVRHGCFRIDLLQVVHDRREFQHFAFLFRRGLDRG